MTTSIAVWEIGIPVCPRVSVPVHEHAPLGDTRDGVVAHEFKKSCLEIGFKHCGANQTLNLVAIHNLGELLASRCGQGTRAVSWILDVEMKAKDHLDES